MLYESQSDLFEIIKFVWISYYRGVLSMFIKFPVQFLLYRYSYHHTDVDDPDWLSFGYYEVIVTYSWLNFVV